MLCFRAIVYFLLSHFFSTNICPLNAHQRYNAQNSSLSLMNVPALANILNNNSQVFMATTSSSSPINFNMKYKKNTKISSERSFNLSGQKKDSDNIVIGFLAEYAQMRVSKFLLFTF